MDHNLLHQYMAHLKVTLHESQHDMVYEGWHEVNRKLTFNKLYFFESGDGLIIIDGVKYNPRPGEILFIPEGCLQTLQMTSPKRYVKYWCHFNAYVGNTPLTRLLDFPLIFKVDDQSHLKDLFEKMTYYFNHNDGFAPLMANALMTEILHYFLTVIAHNQVTLSDETATTKINKLLIYMEDHVDQKCQIDEFAKIVGLHPNYLIRLFKTNFGTSPIDCFNKMKVEKAKELIELNRYSISEISTLLGFSTPFYFSTVFKKATSYSPKDYKKITLSK